MNRKRSIPLWPPKCTRSLTTPFVNNEAYFSGTKPLRPDVKGMGPSLRLVEWNIERGVELADIKLAMTDKQAFLAKVHSEAADNKDKEKISTRNSVHRWTRFNRPMCWC